MKEYVRRAAAERMERPPRSEFGKGWLCALLTLGEECCGMTDKDWPFDIKEARRLIAEGVGRSLREEGLTVEISVMSQY